MYRSRLQKLEERRNMRRAAFLSMGALLTVLLVVILGIPLLVRIAVFFGDIKSATRPVDKNDLIPPVPPQISLPYEATNGAQQTVLGQAEPGSTVWLTLNGENAGEVVTANDGVFSISDINLAEGENVLAAVAVDQTGNKSLSSTKLTVYYSRQPPKLDILSPADRQQISGNNVAISGETAPRARLIINGRLTIVNPDGKFSTSYDLTSGENVLVLIATDRAGNQTRKELTVTTTP